MGCRAEVICGLLLALVIPGGVSFACADGSTIYGIEVRFNANKFSDADVDAVADYLQDQGSDLRALTEDSRPPIFHASLRIDRKGYCDALEAELQSRPYVASVECTEGAGPVGPVE